MALTTLTTEGTHPGTAPSELSHPAQGQFPTRHLQRWPAIDAGPEAGAPGAVSMRPRIGAVALLAILTRLSLPGTALAQEINPPLGPYVHLTEADFTNSTTFSANTPLVMTYYFYWYDIYSNAHIVDGDGTDALTDHPPSLTDFSFKSKPWHLTQLTDMMDAGIDVVLPVYWGAPSERNPTNSQLYWSYAGLGPLLSGREELAQAGKQPPRIGLFYDTSTLLYNSWGEHIDLTTDRGREWFYETIRDFFSLIPPRHWAMINGQPVIFLYSAAFAVAHDQSCIDFVKLSFARDFGGRVPYIVREISWQVQSDNVYAWGGALGLKNPGVASLGPGYNDSAVLGRTPLIVDRQGGAFFERNWNRLLWNPSRIVAVETWNEYHEGTDIAASKEYGRTFIELNRKYADLFKQGVRPPPPRGPYSDVKFVSAMLQATNVENGLDQFDFADGATQASNVAGSDCRAAAPNPTGGRYIYFRIDDSFKWAPAMQAELDVDYFDSAGGSFAVDFDGSDTNAPLNGAYTRSPTTINLTGSQLWRTAWFNVSGAHFMNSQNGGADFRLAVSADPFYVRRVKVIRSGVPDEAGQMTNGYLENFSGPLTTNWASVGAAADSFQPTNGLLRVRSSSNGSGRLLLLLPAADSPTQEVLARVRITRLKTGDASPGGLVISAGTNNQTGFDYLFKGSATAGRQTGLRETSLGWGPQTTLAWTTNAWYWLRLRHAPSSLSGLPDVWVKTWRADGLTPEPPGWLLVWDYYPAQTLRTGFAGLVSGTDGGGSEMECDFFLLKDANLPLITVTLPEQKPALASLMAGQTRGPGIFPLQLAGEPGRSYRVEASLNLSDWLGLNALTLTNGLGQFFDTMATNFSQRFYRARLLP
jgi:hypothetical protein